MASKQRQVVESGLGPVGFRPATEHVNTYTQTAAGQKLSKLAESLAGIAPQLMRFSNQVAEDDKQSAMAKAEAEMRAWDEARTDNDGLKQAIKEGAIRPDQSPWYRWAAKQYFGRKAAGDYEATLTKAVEENLGESYDVEDFNALEAKTRKEFMEGFAGEHRDETFDLAFGRETDSRVAGMRTNFARQAGAKLQKVTLENLSALTAENVVNWWADVPDHESPEARKALAVQIQAEMDRLIGVGEHPQLVNGAVRKALQTIAMQRGMEDVDVVALAQEIVTDKKSGAKLGFIADVQQELDAARDHRLADNHQKSEWERREVEIRQQDAYKTVTGEYVTTLSAAANPASVRPEQIIAQLRAQGITDPSMLSAPYTFYRSAIEGRTTTDEQYKNQLFAGLMGGTTSFRAIQGAVASNRISAADGASLWSTLQQQQDRAARASGGGGQAKALENDAFRLMLTEFKGRWGAEGELKEDVVQRRNFAVGEFAQRWLNYSAQNPGAGLAEQTAWLRNQSEGLFRSLGEPGTVREVVSGAGAANDFRVRQLPREQVHGAIYRLGRAGGSPAGLSNDDHSAAIQLGVPPEAVVDFYIAQGQSYGTRMATPAEFQTQDAGSGPAAPIAPPKKAAKPTGPGPVAAAMTQSRAYQRGVAARVAVQTHDAITNGPKRVADTLTERVNELKEMDANAWDALHNGKPK